MKFLFLDTETTGTDKNKHGIHQLSGSIVIDNIITEIFDIKFKPFDDCEFDEKALQVVNYTEDELKSRIMTEKEAYESFVKILSKYVNKFDKKDKFFLVGYNVHFDKDFLYEMFVRCNDNFLFSYIWGNHIDVMVLGTTKLLSLRWKMENFKQGTVAKFFGFEVSEKELHDALYDIYICMGLYCYITDTNFSIGKNVNNLNTNEIQMMNILQKLAEPVKSSEEIANDSIVTFGKHKGERLGDVILSDPDYLIWLYENAQNQNLVSVELYNKIKKQTKKNTYISRNDKFIDYQLDNHLNDYCDFDDECF